MKAMDRAGSYFLRVILLRMKELGLNQTTLAKRMEVSRPYVTKVLKGEVSITFRTASRFAKALQMDFLPMLTPKMEESAAASLQPGVAWPSRSQMTRSRRSATGCAIA